MRKLGNPGVVERRFYYDRPFETVTRQDTGAAVGRLSDIGYAPVYGDRIFGREILIGSWHE